MRHDPAVTAVGVMHRTTLSIDGAGLPLYSVKMLRGDRPFTVLSGRAPSSANEVLLGPSTSRALHRGVGDQIKLSAGTRAPVTMKIVGTGLLPQEPHSSFDQGAWVTPTAFNRITGASSASLLDAGDLRVVAVFRPSATAKKAGERISTAAHVEVDPIVLPQDVILLRNVRTLPRNLAIFLVLLGIAALGHALVTAVRRRRHDIAVLRTLGFTPRQAALCIVAQASAIGMISLVIGVPIGIVVGPARLAVDGRRDPAALRPADRGRRDPDRHPGHSDRGQRPRRVARATCVADPTCRRPADGRAGLNRDARHTGGA